MGGSSSTAGSLGKSSTAKEVIAHFSNGNPQSFLKGKCAIVTGGNSGIGLEACKALASLGCRVILASRSDENGQKAVAMEMEKPGYGDYVIDSSNVVVKQLDLESLASIQSFADEVLKETRVDYLIFNAGIFACPLRHTQNGWESQIATNHFGHYYLFSLLKDKLVKQSHPSRVVVLSSSAHIMGSVDLSDLHYKKGRAYGNWTAYGQSKKCNILFTKSLADKFKDTPVRAVCLHPGVISTNIQRYLDGFLSFIVDKFIADKTIPQGAATTVYACLNPDFDTQANLNGAYVSDCAVITPDQEACDDNKQLREALWIETEKQLKEALTKQTS